MKLWRCRLFIAEFFSAILPALTFCGSLLVFREFGRFSAIQSVLLASIATALIVVFRSVRWIEKKNFEPFSIHVRPCWYRLLKDHGLIDDDLWVQIQDEAHVSTREEYRVWRDGITLTVLKPNLYYSHDHRCFSSDLDTSEPIEELPARGRFGFTARFDMKLTSVKHPKYGRIRCIKFGLVTEESIGRSNHPDGGAMETAILPDAAFNGYYGTENFRLNRKVKERDLKHLLAEYGWTEEESEYRSTLQHKYVEISYRGI